MSASRSAYSALGMDDDDGPASASSSLSGSGSGSGSSSAAATASLSSVRLAFSERAQAAARAAAGAGAGFSSAASSALGGDAYGFQSSVLEGGADADSAERLLMPSELKGLGGGLVSSSLEDTRKFRWDKPSRIFRLQRGTRCFRFTLLFLSVLIVFSGYFQVRRAGKKERLPPPLQLPPPPPPPPLPLPAQRRATAAVCAAEVARARTQLQRRPAPSVPAAARRGALFALLFAAAPEEACCSALPICNA